MSQFNIIFQKLKSTSVTLSSVFLSAYVVLDWNLAWYGGHSIFGQIVPIIELHFIGYIVSICVLIWHAIHFLLNRKWYRLGIYVLAMVSFVLYIPINQNLVRANGERNAKNALLAMLFTDENPDVWYEKPDFKNDLLKIKKEGSWKVESLYNSYPQHVYAYKLTGADQISLVISVTLLSSGTKFGVTEVDASKRRYK
jgi:hypothetical protein